MKKEKFYITTAIPYVSSIPHIGNVYEAIITDAIARFKRADGFDVIFQTGTDEHGQKIEAKAKEHNISPKEYTDNISSEIIRIFNRLGISYDRFVRTTDQDHCNKVSDIFDYLFKKGDIYLSKYEGWYSVGDEAFVFEKDLIDGKLPNGETPIWTSEETYFFKLSKYQDRLIQYIKDNPNFIYPLSRKNEMLNYFLNETLPDLSVTRSSFTWGVPVSFDKNHVIYVWIDALSNYITGLGYDIKNGNSDKFNKYWPADVHIIGKDILRFHTIYWPILLMALDIELPKCVFGHPWILFNKEKMSKSKHNVIYSDDLIDLFGVDTVRYYCIHEIPFGQDGNLTYEMMIEKNNSDLSNTLGNLVNRTIGMVNKYNNGQVVRTLLDNAPFEYSLDNKSLELLPKIREFINKYDCGAALDEIMLLSRDANKFIDIAQPWVLFKNNDTELLNYTLYQLIETIRFIGVSLSPFLPETSEKILKQINISNNDFSSLNEFGLYPSQLCGTPEILFVRYDISKKLEEIKEYLNGKEANESH
jgi:methionyl-tRNA synthetase